MKKVIAILTICLFVTAGTQMAKAQTQKETIAWIKEKLGQYIKHVKDLEVSPCGISWTEQRSGDPSFNKYSFNPSLAKQWHAGADGRIESSTDNLIHQQAHAEYYGIVYDGLQSDSGFHLIEDKDNLATRMAKALNHLATFCDQE